MTSPTAAPQHPSLLPANFPQLSPKQAHTLITEGFTNFPIADRPTLLKAVADLFEASRSFFAQPQDHKAQFQVRTDNAPGSEEGWSPIPGEKELITIRRGVPTMCPPAVEPFARVFWAECSALMQEVVAAIEQTLGMSPGALDGVVRGEYAMPGDGADRLETLIRMFRYERHTENDPAHAERGRLVAEPHCDRGVLSIVFGASPGLEGWDASAEKWISVESPPHAVPAKGGITATLLGCKTLARLTNSRYTPGLHRVFVPPATPSCDDPEGKYRYSLVFALRPHSEARVSTRPLTTPITGEFEEPIDDMTGRTLYAEIASVGGNVNTGAGVKERMAEMDRLQGKTNQM